MDRLQKVAEFDEAESGPKKKKLKPLKKAILGAAIKGINQYINSSDSFKEAASFGEMMGKQAILDPTLANALIGGGIGALSLGGLGAIGGAISPSDSNEAVFYDKEKTRPVFKPDGTILKKKRSRGQSALLAGLAGLGAGGLSGAALGGLATELNTQHKPATLLGEYIRFKARDKDITGLGPVDNTVNSVADKIGDFAFKHDMNYLLGRPRAEQLRDAASGPFPAVADNPLTNYVRSMFKKQSAFLDLKSVPVGAGPQQMQHALGMLNIARASVNPKDAIAAEGISRKGFENTLDILANKKNDKYEFSSLKKDPKKRSAILGLLGALSGGLAGKLTGQGLASSLGLAAAGGLGGAGYGYLDAASHNKNLAGTANILRAYGLLKPEYLRSAMPLLKTSTFRAYLDDRIQYEGKGDSSNTDRSYCPACGAMKGQVHKPGCDVQKDSDGNITKTCGQDRANRVSDMHESDRYK